ncbi:MAG: ketose-bisphosphate aldolase [Alphaproteobacteria bacterium]|nr:ketose-bisphosphate aldolase [Alphaproteobacteria bacterium]
MTYKDFGLVNTRAMFADAIKRGYAVPAFNFYNMETLQAICRATSETHSPVILAVSESAMKYMTPDMLMGMIRGMGFTPGNVALHLDHGGSFEACQKAIQLGFSSVMIDGSKLPLDENIALARRVAEYAHQFDVTVEAELGTLSGIEDENTFSDVSHYTNPADVVRFVRESGIDSLAIAIGTSHGAYKRKNDNEELRFDILAEIARELPEFPLVLHGASSIPQHLVKTINELGGALKDARGIPADQLRRAVSMNICKINVDSDSRLAFTAALRKSFVDNPENFDPRKYLTAARENITENCIAEIRDIMNSQDKAM